MKIIIKNKIAISKTIGFQGFDLQLPMNKLFCKNFKPIFLYHYCMESFFGVFNIFADNEHYLDMEEMVIPYFTLNYNDY